MDGWVDRFVDRWNVLYDIMLVCSFIKVFSLGVLSCCMGAVHWLSMPIL